MSLFNFFKKQKAAEPPRAKENAAGAVSVPAPAARKIPVAAETEKTLSREGPRSLRPGILIRPRITEKASTGGARGVYAFEVSPRARKRDIAAAVAAAYHVMPVKVAITRIPHKRILHKGIRGTTGGGKKAYVYLRPGDKIEVR